ncbi:MAG: arylamine N-acetyltransferase, partial [Clostridiales bacterium]|nr:arylamine N-acetyltransferase [Clostridiales bacterium]
GLSALAYAHQTTVPFENYDICELGRPISLEVEKLYEKIVLNRRGGYCFEMNGAFAALLTALGFDVWPILARLYRAPLGEEATPPSHRVNLVHLDGKKYIVDVGFGGPMSRGALLLEADTVQDVRGNLYHFEKRPHNRWALYRESSEGEIVPMLGFTETPAEPVDFIAPNFYTSTNPESMFVRGRIANLRRNDAHASISNGEFHQIRDGVDTTVAIESKAQEFAILEEHFGIVLR